MPILLFRPFPLERITERLCKEYDIPLSYEGKPNADSCVRRAFFEGVELHYVTGLERTPPNKNWEQREYLFISMPCKKTQYPAASELVSVCAVLHCVDSGEKRFHKMVDPAMLSLRTEEVVDSLLEVLRRLEKTFPKQPSEDEIYSIAKLVMHQCREE